MATEVDTLLRARSLAIGRGRMSLLENISFDLQPGQLVALIGNNGIGKSTLLRTLAGLDPALAGTIQLNGTDLRSLEPRGRARLVSIVLTGRPVAGMLDVRTIVALGRQPWTGHLGRLSAEDHRHVEEALQTAGIVDLKHRSLQQLSDGECQKVVIARALAQRTSLMLLDEPTAYLDLTNRVRIARLLRSLTRSGPRAVLFSTHDLQLALDLCDKLLLLRRDRTMWIGDPREAIDQGVLAGEFDDPHVRFDAKAGVFRAV